HHRGAGRACGGQVADQAGRRDHGRARRLDARPAGEPGPGTRPRLRPVGSRAPRTTMDPVTQGLLGAAAAQVLLGRRLGRRAWLYGAVGGMAADLDVLIRSSDDPLVALRYHRHFTHSLAFVPVGGVLSALPWVLRTRFAEHRRSIVLGTTAGYATHALLDAFTSYGTMLWWPLSQARVAWN